MSSEPSFSSGLFRALIVVSASILVGALCLEVARSPMQTWNGLRVVGPVAFAKGMRVYYPEGEGPLLSGQNGPVSVLAYAPAALGSGPLDAIRIGCLLALLFFFLPVLWIHLGHGGKGKGDRLWGWASFVLFSLLAFRSRALGLSATLIHADAPALGLGLASCAALVGIPNRGSLPRFVASAVLCWLAVLSKITLLPLGVACCAHVAARSGPREACRFAAILAVTGAALAGLAHLAFGAGIFYSNVQMVAKSHWVGSLSVPFPPPAVGFAAKAKVLVAAASELLQEYYAVVIFFVLFASLALRRARRPAWDAAWESAWALPLVASLLLIPPALMGRVKAGGALNTQSPFVYFFTVALTLCVRDLARAGQEATREVARSFAGIAILVLSGLQLVAAYSLVASLRSGAEIPLETAYHYAQAHPGTTYFAEFPLASLLAESQLYHSWPAVSECATNGNAISREQLERFLPPRMEAIAFYGEPVGPIEQYLPDYTRKIALDGLPGWKILVRK